MENNKNTDPNIKIYVACHKDSYVPKNPYLYPIQVGTALSDNPLRGMLHDDTGNNISIKNKSYCELTAQYWAWKNDDADYYGFFHYRRYFAFDPSLNRDDGWGNIVYDRINDSAIEEMRLKPDIMSELITKYDVISVKGRKYPRTLEDGKPLNVYMEYGRASFQHRKDLDVALKILKEKYPEFCDAADEYMHSSTCHECNMFIMRKDIFHKYCEWLFDILFEVEKNIDTTFYSVEENRVMGYLGERLCGIYYTYLLDQENVRTFELPKVLFKDTEPLADISPVYDDGIPVVLSANEKFAPYLDVMIRSIIANSVSDRNYDIIVLYNDITPKSRQIISRAAKGKENISIRFVKVSAFFDSEKLFVDQHLSVETYYRLAIPEIMPNYHKIIYLDCDMVADHDIAELFDIDLNGNIIAAVKDIDVAGQVKLQQNDWQKYAVETLGLDNPFDYFQAGTLVIDLNALRKITSTEELIQLALSRSWRCHDQDILNVVCKGKVYYLPQYWNVLMNWEEPQEGRSRMQIMQEAPGGLYEEYLDARNNPYLVHFAGYQKPWDVMDCDMAEYFWEYAKLSSYYPQILRKPYRCFENDGNTSEPDSFIIQAQKTPIIRRIANVILPYGTRRREWVKKIYKAIIN